MSIDAIGPIESFDIPSLEARVSDFRVAPGQDIKDSKWIFWESLQGAILNKERPDVSLCSPNDPGYDVDLQNISFVVYQKANDDLVVSGLFNLYNIKQELVTDDLIEVSAMIAPWAGQMNGLNIGKTIACLMKCLLEINLPIIGGSQALDIVQWDFPFVKGQRWSRSANCDTAIQQMADDDTILRYELDALEPTGDFPKDIRRKNKPRPKNLNQGGLE